MASQLHRPLFELNSDQGLESPTACNVHQDFKDSTRPCLSSFQITVLMRITLPFLLWVQFALALAGSSAQSHLSWPSIQWCIAMYAVASILYSHSLSSYTEAHGDSSVAVFVHLWPEISADIVLFLVLFHFLEVAAMFLIFAELVLVVNAILFKCYSYAPSNCDSDEDEVTSLSKDVESNYEILVV